MISSIIIISLPTCQQSLPAEPASRACQQSLLEEKWEVLLGIRLLGTTFLVWIVKPSGCHRTDGHLTSRAFTEDQKISRSADPP